MAKSATASVHRVSASHPASTTHTNVPNPSSVGPQGNPGNHDNQGWKNAIQVEELKKKYDLDELVGKYGTMSGVIRFPASENYERGAIAKFTGKRYQHVRNVLMQPMVHENA